MGANYVEHVIKAKNDKELKARFDDLQDQCRHENGHSYSGEIGMADGLELLNPKGLIYLSQNEAVKAANDRAEKWGPAIAAPFMTQSGSHAYVVVAICSS